MNNEPLFLEKSLVVSFEVPNFAPLLKSKYTASVAQLVRAHDC